MWIILKGEQLCLQTGCRICGWQVQQQGGITSQSGYPNVIDTQVVQPIEVKHITSPGANKAVVPRIEIPYVEIWKAHRLHPQNPWRFIWYPAYFLGDCIKSPVGVGAVGSWLLFLLVNFLLNGSYQGPGYVNGKKIEVVPEKVPTISMPVVRQLE
ncbi:hypothetical protein DSM106972_066840 [Dulcicalothrix desertica PCC 7102]|uniref:Uncharacterized protein n=2 Tax=Dulcicalothrix desertica TaxID=32056 RepID=A0A3S1ISF4_9CYAN|nr:hypothetical protein DSM106972_066840 [Dulcicalothrix desertica PCC 7102]